MAAHPRTPVIVGVGQKTDHSAPSDGMSPIDLMAQAAGRAAMNTGIGYAALSAIDATMAVRFVVDTTLDGSKGEMRYNNPARSLTKKLGLEDSATFINGGGGNSPQQLVNAAADLIAKGEADTVLVAGSEALRTLVGRRKEGLSLEDFSQQESEEPTLVGEMRGGALPAEQAVGMHIPTSVYAMFGHYIRSKRQQTVPEYQLSCGELFSRYNEVAHENLDAWFGERRQALEISTPSKQNRMVSHPFTKYMCAVMRVNQGAAVLLMSSEKADELQLEERKRVYLHGSGDAHDHWYVSERAGWDTSPAIKALGEQALGQANKTIDDIKYFDIYSCFPSAVQAACASLGIPTNDRRSLTVTGGLPYFGGAGNNYSMHAIASMVEKLRDDPGSYGLVTANGWYLTKHSMGVYSTKPFEGEWSLADSSVAQAQVDAQPKKTLVEDASEGVIVTYTLNAGREGIDRAVIVGEDSNGNRFVATAPGDSESVRRMERMDAIGSRVTVTQRPNEPLEFALVL